MPSMALKFYVPISFLNLLILLLSSTQTNTTSRKSDETCNWRDQNKMEIFFNLLPSLLVSLVLPWNPLFATSRNSSVLGKLLI